MTSRVEGIGIGFRYGFADALLAADVPELRWLEIHPENYVGRGGRFRYRLDQARERYPLATHGLTLGVGAVMPAEDDYVAPLAAFLADIGTPWHSEHLCFSGTGGVMLHDLLPLPFSPQSIATAACRIGELRDRIERPLAIENVSYYAHPGGPPQMEEVDFLLQVLEAADAKLLLDVNNVWVNSQNHGFDARAFLDRIPAERVVQIHVAGPTVRPDGLIIDTHGEAVRSECYELLEHVLERLGPVPVLLERDQNFPPFAELVSEIRQLDAIYQRAIAVHAARCARNVAEGPAGDAERALV
ncbi:MAG: DUF692 domain-containing protein [Myxococcales bacterium]|nr:DUF692 domain-containing protein [Myxococcales bacterium]